MTVVIIITIMFLVIRISQTGCSQQNSKSWIDTDYLFIIQTLNIGAVWTPLSVQR